MIAVEATPLETALALRDRGMEWFDQAEAPTGEKPREFLYDDAEADLQQSFYELVDIRGQHIEVYVTQGFLGRVAYSRGNKKRGRELMRTASRGLHKHPVYYLNNHIWRILASPWRRWYLVPVGVWLVATKKPHHNLHALTRVLAAAGGFHLYNALQR